MGQTTIKGDVGPNGRDIKDIKYDPIFHQFDITYSDGVTQPPITVQTLIKGDIGPVGKGMNNITYNPTTQNISITGNINKDIPLTSILNNNVSNNTLWCSNGTCTLPDNQNINMGSVLAANNILDINSTIVGAPYYAPGSKIQNNDNVQFNINNSIKTSNGNTIDTNGAQIMNGGVYMQKGFGPYQIKSDSGFCLDSSQCSSNNCKGNCMTSTDAQIDNQLWYYNPSTGRLYNKAMNQCFSNNGSFSGGKWGLAPCDLADRNQYWTKTELNQFQTSNIRSGNCIDFNSGGVNGNCGSNSNPAVPSAIFKLYPINK